MKIYILLAVLAVLLAVWDFRKIPFLPPFLRLGLSSFPWLNWRRARAPEIQPGGLAGKIAVVTGGTSGIGLETAKALAAGGARVFVTARDAGKAENALKKFPGNSDVTWLLLDLGDLNSVSSFAEKFPGPRIDFLVLNAGMNIPGAPRKNLDGFESMFGAHHVSHFFLFKLLRSRLAEKGGRVVVTSSALMAGVEGIDWRSLETPEDVPELAGKFYHQSKLANVLFALEGQKKFPGLIFSSNHPGLVRTPILGENSICEKFPGFCFEPEEGAIPNLLGCLAPDVAGNFILPGGAYADPGTELPAAARNATLAAELWEWTEAALAKRQF